jgi:hypothetical protein
MSKGVKSKPEGDGTGPLVAIAREDEEETASLRSSHESVMVERLERPSATWKWKRKSSKMEKNAA